MRRYECVPLVYSLSLRLTHAFAQDEDGNTPLDLARLAEQDDLVALLS
jgi:ankyrin repeat protein